MSTFWKSSLEAAIVSLLKKQGYTYVLGDTIEKDQYEVLLKDVLRTYLNTRYASEGITNLEIEATVIIGAPCRRAGGSRADGVSVTHLSFPAVSFHEDLSAIDHPEMTPDRNGLAGLFLTDYCKALPNAFESNLKFHLKNVLHNGSKERLK